MSKTRPARILSRVAILFIFIMFQRKIFRTAENLEQKQEKSFSLGFSIRYHPGKPGFQFGLNARLLEESGKP